MEICINTNQHMKELYCENYLIQFFFTAAEHMRIDWWPSYSFPHCYCLKLFAVYSNFADFYWFSTLLVTSHFLYAPSFHQCSFSSRPPPTSYFIFPSVSVFYPCAYTVDKKTTKKKHIHMYVHTYTHTHAEKSLWPKQNVTQYPKVNLDRKQRGSVL